MLSSQQYISCRERILNSAFSELESAISAAVQECRDQVEADIIRKFRDALDQAIDDGETAEKERSDLEEKVADLDDELSELRDKRDQLQAEIEKLEAQLQLRLDL